MEMQSPLGLEISEPIVTSNQTTPETNMNEDKINVNQNKTEHFSHTAAIKCLVTNGNESISNYLQLFFA